MIPGVKSTTAFELSTGVPELVLAPTFARHALLTGRWAESMGDGKEAANQFQIALDLLGTHSSGSTAADLIRAGAMAGLARVRGCADHRRAAVQVFTRVAIDELDGADLADWAASVEPDDPRRQELYSAAVARGNAPPWAFEALGVDALEDGDIDGAVRHLGQAVMRAPLEAAYLEKYGLALRRSGQSATAASALRSAAALHAMAGNRESVRRVVQEAATVKPTGPVEDLILGDILRASNDLNGALERLSSACDTIPADSNLGVVARRAFARALAEDGHRQRALQILKPIVADADAVPDDLVLAGELQAALGDDIAATATYERAAMAAPTRSDVLDALIRHHLRSGRLGDAQRVVRNAIERAARDGEPKPELCVVLGELRYRAEETGAPEDEIAQSRLLGLDPARAWAMIGEMRDNDGDRVGALEAYGKAVMLKPNEVSLRVRRGKLARDTENVDIALAEFEEAARLRPDDPDTQLLLGDVRLRKGDTAGTQTAIDTALCLAPNHPLLLALRGVIRHAHDDLDGAIGDLEASIRLDPSLVWPTVELFTLHANRSGQEEAATRIVRLILEAGDGTSILSTARKLREASPAAAVALTTVYLAAEPYRPSQPEERAALLVLRGEAHNDLGDFASAEFDLRAALQLVPRHAQAQVKLAITHINQRQPNAASNAARLARKLEPGSADIAFWSVSVIERSEGIDAALHEVDEALGQIGANPTLLRLHARLLLDADRPGEAIEVVNRLRARWPTFDVDRIEGIGLARIGEFGRAQELLEAVVQRDPDDVDARSELAECLIARGRPEVAVDLLSGVEASDPGSDVALTYRGVALAASGRLDEACTTFLAVLSDADDFRWPRIELVQNAWELRRIDLARQHLAVLLADEGLRGNTEVARLAWLIMGSNEGLARFDDILTRDSDNPTAWMLRGAILLERNDHAGAVAAGAEALARDPDLVDARLLLADAHLAQQRPQDALAVLGNASDPDLELERAEILFELNQAAAAVEVTDRLLATAPNRDNIELLVRAANLLLWWDHTDRAIAIVEPLLADQPGASAEVLSTGGSILSSIGEFEQAVSVLEAARARNPNASDIHADLTWAYSNLTEPPLEMELTASEHALANAPGDPWLKKAKADVLRQLGQVDAARQLYSEVLEHDLDAMDSPQDRHSLGGWCCYRIGDFERATDHLLRSTSIDLARATGDQLDLGLVLLASGRWRLAAEEYKRAFQDLRNKTGDLRRHGLLRVGLTDLNEAIESGAIEQRSEALQLRKDLEQEVAFCRPTFKLIETFLSRAAAAAESIQQ
jgi:tetratricopeptide (TPR) repeat protein